MNSRVEEVKVGAPAVVAGLKRGFAKGSGQEFGTSCARLVLVRTLQSTSSSLSPFAERNDIKWSLRAQTLLAQLAVDALDVATFLLKEAFESYDDIKSLL